jgi:hypothetical protein
VNRQLTLCKFGPESPGHGTKKHLLEAVFLEVANVAGSVVILAIAGNRLIAVDGEIVLRFTCQCAAGEPLAAEPDRPLQVKLDPLTNHIAKDPVKSPALHGRASSTSIFGTKSITQHTPTLAGEGQTLVVLRRLNP